MKLRSLSEYVTDDLVRLGELFKVYRAMSGKDPQVRRDLFHAYIAGLRRHIEWEEKILFPLLEQRLGLEDRGPAFGLREDHRRIENLIESIHDRVIRKGEEAEEAEAGLTALLNDHNESASAGLYSMLDRSLDEGEKLRTYRRMKEIPIPKNRPCCESTPTVRND